MEGSRMMALVVAEIGIGVVIAFAFWTYVAPAAVSTQVPTATA